MLFFMRKPCVNWEVKIGACKFLSAYGGGWTDDAVECFDYVLGLKNAGVNVLVTNNSWGGGGFSQTLHDAIEANIAAGVLPVIAAGNWSDNNDNYPYYPSSYMFPDVQGDSISVAAIDSGNNLAWFSSYGPTSVDVAAPGVDILSTLPGNSYGSYDGTSMATPHVVGLAALIAADEPGSSLVEIREAILCGTVSTPSLAGKIVTGGRVNAYNSLQAHCPPSISITAPESLSVVSGDVSLTADASSEYGIAQVEFFVNDSSVGIDTTYPYSVIWDASVSTPDIYTVKAVATDTDGVIGSDQVEMYVVSGCFDQPEALILDLGSDNDSGAAIGAALARSNISPIHADSITDIDPNEYPLVFIALGYYPGQHVLTAAESVYLSTYLDNGGMLYMEGGDTWYWDPDRPVHDYFGIIGAADGGHDLATVNGISGGLADGISFTATGTNAWVDRLQPVNGGVAVWENSSPSYIAGVSNQTATYRTVGCSFEFGNIPDQATQTDVMAAYLSFFEVTSCSVNQICPCENDWKNHGKYVQCVSHAAEDCLLAGLITGEEKGCLVSTAAKSECGKKK